MSQPNPEFRDDPLAEANPAGVPPTPVSTQTLPVMNYNMKSPAVKRILREAAENAKEDRTVISAAPLDDNIFEWHFTIRGPPDTPFELGMYHGRIILPSNYPMSPPNIMLLNPSGRFDVNTKICLSISSYHPESWQPSWSIRTALTALRSFMATDSPGAIGSTQCADDARREMAKKSRWFECSCCGFVFTQLDAIAIDERTEIRTVPKDLRKKVEAHLTSPVVSRNAYPPPSTRILHPQPDFRPHDDRAGAINRLISSESFSSSVSGEGELHIQLIEDFSQQTSQISMNTGIREERRPHSIAETPVSTTRPTISEETFRIPASPTTSQWSLIPRCVTDLAIATVVVFIGVIIMKRLL